MSKIDINENKCVHCGACALVCKAKALEMDKKEWKISFNKSKCTGCEACLKICPLRAISIRLETRWLYA